MTNEYIPFLSKIKEIVKHTETEYTFRMTYVGEVKPGQFFEVSNTQSEAVADADNSADPHAVIAPNLPQSVL